MAWMSLLGSSSLCQFRRLAQSRSSNHRASDRRWHKRCNFATLRKICPESDRLRSLLWDNLPHIPNEAPPPRAEPPDPSTYYRSKVTSAHMIDVKNKAVSVRDSVAVSPHGTVVHGLYGDLGAAAEAIPLEYLALLRPAAEGAAALRVLMHHQRRTQSPNKGTLLIYGAMQASGLALAQLAVSLGHTVVGVVDSQHSGNDVAMEAMKEILKEPGTVIPEEYAISKKKFADLVANIVSGDEGIRPAQPDVFLEDFKNNIIDYAIEYPASRGAAISAEELEFKYMERYRETFEANMEAYLSQMPQGSPPMDRAKLDAYFTLEQYEVMRKKFWIQTTSVISGDDFPFSAPLIVNRLVEKSETMDHRTYPGAGPEVPYSYSVLQPNAVPPHTDMPVGGPLLGAVLVVTPELYAVNERLAQCTTVREKAEAFHFLPRDDRGVYLAAASIMAVARAAKAPIVCVGGTLTGTDAIATGDAIFSDVQTALSAMDIDEHGKTRVNYFVQVYRANDFPYYGEFAVQRACEVLPGPRQIVVTK